MSKKSCEEIRSLMRIAKTYSPAFEPIIELLDRTRSELRKAEKAWRDGGEMSYLRSCLLLDTGVFRLGSYNRFSVYVALLGAFDFRS